MERVREGFLTFPDVSWRIRGGGFILLAGVHGLNSCGQCFGIITVMMIFFLTGCWP